MAEKFFVASCVFTEEYPELSRKVQSYIETRFNLPIIRCCVANYKVEEFENRMPNWYRDEWRGIEHYRKFPSGSTMVSLCHNCVRGKTRRQENFSFGGTFIQLAVSS